MNLWPEYWRDEVELGERVAMEIRRQQYAGLFLADLRRVLDG